MTDDTTRPEGQAPEDPSAGQLPASGREAGSVGDPTRSEAPAGVQAVATAAPADGDGPEGSRAGQVLREIASGSALLSVLAVVLSLIVGALLIAVTDEETQKAAGYFFSRPLDTLRAGWDAASGAYSALFQGSIYNFRRPGFANGIKPLTETLTFATPLIAAGLGVALAFRVGLFNIGARGQMLIAAACAGWVGFGFDLPPVIHLVLAVAAGIVGGAVWGGIVGLLKARTGAHEVIVTIMLNYVAFYLLSYLLRTPGLLQAPGSNNPKTPAMAENAIFPALLGDGYSLHAGFLVVVVATVIVWYLLNRSGLGFRFRAVGENPSAARVAGIDVKNSYLYAMLISGGLAGLAGASQVLGTVTTGFSSGIDAGIGFDAITVALLGRSRPWGVFVAGILFGAFKAGGFSMQAAEGVPIDIVVVVQSLIVLFIAAPPLVRAVFRLPAPGQARRTTRTRKAAIAS
ncbi:ABC transporter permease [Clavibacter michiganensis]|uniref:ABC transporter permease n=1 Tax=Clavibacter michiganensis TaxID=28447 RepID=UPI0009D16612|nr:ABC transporter permease [Clavibacter michiganensis]MBF4639234.1 ABC transporter permease [Clavibacter michiganensis subsp. michiganensis]MDO4018411.1 ABC transporter permease [Clavibacter michiganensis]MDO4038116.1 ABC transporter permease [Clavibacter michiganensis]MDO4040533.1 ABC transporter permease [Clavibacter michiganensis]MDO4049410.1 ABC transporter permease [Clavibacter michiganensis]